MQIIKEKLEIDEVLEKRIKNTLRFLNIKSKIIKGNIIHIPKTNIAYIEPSRLIVDGKCYLIFGSNEINYISETNIYNEFPIKQLEDKIRRDAIK